MLRWSHLLTLDPWKDWAAPQINGKGYDRQLELNITVPFVMPVSFSCSYILYFVCDSLENSPFAVSLRSESKLLFSALKYAPFSLRDSSICPLRIFPSSYLTSFLYNISLSQAWHLIICVRMRIHPPLWLSIHSFSMFGLFWTISTLLGARANSSDCHIRYNVDVILFLPLSRKSGFTPILTNWNLTLDNKFDPVEKFLVLDLIRDSVIIFLGDPIYPTSFWSWVSLQTPDYRPYKISCPDSDFLLLSFCLGFMHSGIVYDFGIWPATNQDYFSAGSPACWKRS